MAVLYQKYRPQKFSEVVGQDGIVKTLTNASAAGQLSHAYLLTGSRGVGKTTVARLVAKAANCLNLKAGDPCGVCDVCRAIAADNFLDVVEIDAASHTGVDNIRELIEHVQFRPTQAKMKVFIIDEVHMLSKSAFNALLKTLEEPPEHAMFVLATTDIEKVPDTIVSRTQRFDFRKIAPETMRDTLTDIAKKESMHLPSGSLELIVNNAEGGLRDALSMLGTVAALGKTATSEDVRMLLGLTTISSIEELVSKVCANETASIPEFFENQSAAGTDFNLFNKHLLEYLRLMLVYKMVGSISGGTLEDSQAEHLQSLSDRLSLPHLLYMIRLYLRSYKEVAQSPLPELPMLLASIEAALQISGASVRVVEQSVQPVPKVSENKSTPTKDKKAPPKASAAIEAVVEEKVSPEIVAVSGIGSADKQSIEEVMVWWPEVVQRIKTVNSPLATLLKNSPLVDVSEGKITIGVKYLFHKEHLENTKHTALILEAITGVCGKRMYFKTVILKSKDETVVAQTVDALSDAIKIFGGELVE